MPPATDDFTKRLNSALRVAKPGTTGGPATSAADSTTKVLSKSDDAPASVGADQSDSTSDSSNAGATPAAQSNTQDAAPVGSGDHVVRSGECVSSIAKTSGHFWQTIWDDAANTEIKNTRRQPNVLLPGDRLCVPPIRPKQEPGQTELRHRFVRRGEPSHFRARILDQDIVRANEPFTLVIDGNQTITGITDPEGKIDVPIPGNAKKAVLTVGEIPDVLKLNINLGGLEPVESWTGVQSRLKNLGFACDVTGEGDAQTIDALNEFRHSINKPFSNEIDDATRQDLLAKHGS